MQIINLQNAYGIKKLEFEDGNRTLKNAIIYSSNGTFKSSFANCLYNLSKGDGEKVFDRLSTSTDSKLKCTIQLNGEKYDQNSVIENILVYSKELVEYSNWNQGASVSELIISNDYKNDLKEIKSKISSISSYYSSLIDKNGISIINKINASISFEGSVTLEDLEKKLITLKDAKPIEVPEGFDISKFDQSAYAAIDTPKFLELATALIDVVNGQLQSDLFDESFGIDNVINIISALSKNNFLNSKRKIIIKIYGIEQCFDNQEYFEDFINKEIKRILKNNPDAHNLKSKLDKELGKTKLANIIKQQITDMKWLDFYSQGRVNILNSILHNLIDKQMLHQHLELIQELKKRVDSLKRQVEQQKSLFEKAVQIHKDRFQPPFDIQIINKSDTVINAQLPLFKFLPNSTIDCEKTYDETRNILSTGERNAFDIINLIVQYESLVDKSQAVIVLDDIVETFDYSNRIAFMEYIQDMKDNNSNVIVLTHNFEFFRALSSRFNEDFRSFCASNINGIVTICSSEYLNFNFKNMFTIKDLSNGKSSKNLNKEEFFLSSLPFVREVSRFLPNEEVDFTYLFHYKSRKLDIKVHQVVSDIKSAINNYKIEDSAMDLNNNNESYYEFIQRICKQIIKSDIKSYDLFRKVILSMGCRLQAEALMINDDYSKIENITGYQTKKLYIQESKAMSDNGKKLVNSVLLSSSEFIHLNAFMYEPLIDIDPTKLIELYRSLVEIGDDFYINKHN